jgi:hypothetical protein
MVANSEVVPTVMMLVTSIAGPKVCIREVGLKNSTYSQYLSLLTSAIDLLLQSTCYMHRTTLVIPHFKCTF